jgi:hypothetical protein
MTTVLHLLLFPFLVVFYGAVGLALCATFIVAACWFLRRVEILTELARGHR